MQANSREIILYRLDKDSNEWGNSPKIYHNKRPARPLYIEYDLCFLVDDF